MPVKRSARMVRFANLERLSVRCPYCEHNNTYVGEIIRETDQTIQCRECHRRFLLYELEKDKRACEACRCRIPTVEYREGCRVHLFCFDCAGVFDSMLAEWEAAFNSFLKTIVPEIRHRRKREAAKVSP